MIKAIETIYAGHRFRSRLEARWAVVLDHLGIRWQYEPQGFETSAGPYLPDFRVDPRHVNHEEGTSGDVYLEVKGGPLSFHDADRLRAFACDPGEPRWVLALGPIPDPRTELPFLMGWGMGGAGRAWLSMEGEPALKMEPPYNSAAVWGTTRSELMDYSFQDMGLGLTHDAAWQLGRPVGKALTAGRSARFEHGESGAR